MKGLTDYSLTDLKAEIELREAILKNKPEPRDAPDFRKVIELCCSELENFAENHPALRDSDYFIYKAAMEAVFGEDVYEWINQITGVQ